MVPEKRATRFTAVIFDLDGVITQTRHLHMEAWKKLFDNFLNHVDQGDRSPFTDEDYLSYVDGLPRYDGVECFLKSRHIILPHGSPSDIPWQEDQGINTTICAVGNLKDNLFNQLLQEKGVVVYDSTIAVIYELISRGIRIGVASSSKNCVPILKQLGLIAFFNAVVDGVMLENEGIKGKPAPDMFLKCLELTCAGTEPIPPQDAVLVEDAQSGVAAGRKGKFGLVIGIDRGNNREALLKGGAHIVINDFKDVSVAQLDEWFGNVQAGQAAH